MRIGCGVGDGSRLMGGAAVSAADAVGNATFDVDGWFGAVG